MAKRKFPYMLTVGILLLVGTASWAFYSLINNGVKDILLLIGIENFYLQNIIIIIFVFLLLLLIGFGGKKAFSKILK